MRPDVGAAYDRLAASASATVRVLGADRLQDSDDWALCALCGREPAIRLAAGGPESASVI